MSFPEDLVARLERITGLTALVGDRIYPGGIPQEPALPALSFRTLSADPNARLASQLGTVPKLLVEFTTYGKTLIEAYRVVGALRSGLEAADENPSPTKLVAAIRQTWQDGYVPEVRSYVVVQQYTLFHQE